MIQIQILMYLLIDLIFQAEKNKHQQGANLQAMDSALEFQRQTSKFSWLQNISLINV